MMASRLAQAAVVLACITMVFAQAPEVAPMSADDVVPEDDGVTALVDAGLAEVLKQDAAALQSLVAYSQLAYEGAGQFSSKSANSLVGLIKALGYHDPKAPIYAVTPATYDAALSKLKKKYTLGMGKYLLEHVDAALAKGETVLGDMPLHDTKGVHKVGFSYQVLGLRARPLYFVTLSVPNGKYLNRLAEIKSAPPAPKKKTCCDDGSATCEACQKGMTVAQFCVEFPIKCGGTKEDELPPYKPPPVVVPTGSGSGATAAMPEA